MIYRIALALLWLTHGSAHAFAWPDQAWLSEMGLSQFSANATLKRASVPACPNEQARELSVSLIDGQVQGHVAELSLDLTCSQSRLTSSNKAADNDALSLLLTLPAIDLTIDNLILQLSL